MPAETIVMPTIKNKNTNVAWIEEEFSFYPYFFEQSGLELEKICFIESGSHWSWCAKQALSSQLFNCVVLGGGTRNQLEMRRIQLLAEKNKIIVFLISPEVTQVGAWSIQKQYQVQRQFDGSIVVHSYHSQKRALKNDSVFSITRE